MGMLAAYLWMKEPTESFRGFSDQQMIDIINSYFPLRGATY